MKRLIGARAAANVLLGGLGALAGLHVFVMLRILPASVVWGGRSNDSPGNLMALEMVSLIVTLLFGLIVAAKIGYVVVPKLRKIISVSTWVVFGYFAFNTLTSCIGVSAGARDGLRRLRSSRAAAGARLNDS